MPGKKRPPLTLEEHQELATVLWESRRAYDDLRAKLDEHYPARVGDAAHRVAQAIDNLRGILDALLYRERQGEDRTGLHGVYYPGSTRA